MPAPHCAPRRPSRRWGAAAGTRGWWRSPATAAGSGCATPTLDQLTSDASNDPEEAEEELYTLMYYANDVVLSLLMNACKLKYG
ncbi:unnamed protein product [Nezara viridula]|uniref:Uncharacterized protein n=1 Tax=Nezara viridula TaxID=85310 RepID=A0A9P0EB90_NEZVI|nr:unnamed protein product [Nezara viridula]